MSLRVGVARGDAAGLDALAADAVALPLWAVRGQPRSAAGFVDWRLSGRVARLLASGRFAGGPGEALLMPSLGRLGASRIFLLGLGAPRAAAAELFASPLEVLAGAGVSGLAVALPVVPGPVVPGGPAPAGEEVEAALAFVAALGRAPASLGDVRLLDGSGALAAAAKRLEEAARAAGVAWAAP